MVGIDPQILSMIFLASRAFDVPAGLICAVIDRESSWNIHAFGDRDEKEIPHSFSLMQVNDRGAGSGYGQDVLLNPYANIMIGTEYLSSCLKMYPNNIKLAISAYNQGQAGAAKRGYGFNEGYVNDVLGLWKKYDDFLKEEHGKKGTD